VAEFLRKIDRATPRDKTLHLIVDDQKRARHLAEGHSRQ
jgi:hypothetical protein